MRNKGSESKCIFGHTEYARYWNEDNAGFIYYMAWQGAKAKPLITLMKQLHERLSFE